MGLIRESKNVDFTVQSKPWTEEEFRDFRKLINKLKLKNTKRKIRSIPAKKVIKAQVQKPDTLTTTGRFNCNDPKYFNNKHLISAKGGQFTPARSGQSHWILHFV